MAAPALLSRKYTSFRNYSCAQGWVVKIARMVRMRRHTSTKSRSIALLVRGLHRPRLGLQPRLALARDPLIHAVKGNSLLRYCRL